MQVELIRADMVGIQIGQSPLIIMNHQQAYNLAKAMRIMFPKKIGINESGFCELEGR